MTDVKWNSTWCLYFLLAFTSKKSRSTGRKTKEFANFLFFDTMQSNKMGHIFLAIPFLEADSFLCLIFVEVLALSYHLLRNKLVPSTYWGEESQRSTIKIFNQMRVLCVWVSQHRGSLLCSGHSQLVWFSWHTCSHYCLPPARRKADGFTFSSSLGWP